MLKKEIKNKSGNKIGWEVILFFSLYVISPSYFAIEISEKLPLITFSRVLLLLMGGMLLIRRRNNLFNRETLSWKTWNFQLTEVSFLRNGILGYFLLLLICDIALLPQDFAESLKATFTLLVEGYLLIWMLTVIIDTREKLVAGLKALVYASGIIGVVVAVGCIFECNPFQFLNTTQREMLMNAEYRLGMVRAAAGFGHPVYYGAFCAVILPINMYFIEQSNKRRKRYLFAGCMSMNIVGLVLSNARGAVFALGCLVVFAVIRSVIRREFKKFFRMYIAVVGAAIVVLVLVSMLAPVGIKFLWGYVHSLILVAFPDFDKVVLSGIGNSGLDALPEAGTSGTDILSAIGLEYGANASGGASRVAQLSGISYTLQNKPLFGFGSNAHTKGLIMYQFRPGAWWPVNTVDVGIVAIICQYGVVGCLGYVLLYGSAMLSAFKFRRDNLMQSLGVSFATYMICLLTISSLSKMEWVLIAAIVCLTNIILKEGKDVCKNQ